MLADVLHAQASTLRDWANEFEREVLVSPEVSGVGEVAMLLRRAARAMDRIGKPDEKADPVPQGVFDDHGDLHVAEPQASVRPDEA